MKVIFNKDENTAKTCFLASAREQYFIEANATRLILTIPYEESVMIDLKDYFYRTKIKTITVYSNNEKIIYETNKYIKVSNISYSITDSANYDTIFLDFVEDI